MCLQHLTQIGRERVEIAQMALRSRRCSAARAPARFTDWAMELPHPISNIGVPRSDRGWNREHMDRQRRNWDRDSWWSARRNRAGRWRLAARQAVFQTGGMAGTGEAKVLIWA